MSDLSGGKGAGEWAFVPGSVSHWLWVVNLQAFPDKVSLPWWRAMLQRRAAVSC